MPPYSLLKPVKKTLRHNTLVTVDARALAPRQNEKKNQAGNRIVTWIQFLFHFLPISSYIFCFEIYFYFSRIHVNIFVWNREFSCSQANVDINISFCCYLFSCSLRTSFPSQPHTPKTCLQEPVFFIYFFISNTRHPSSSTIRPSDVSPIR